MPTVIFTSAIDGTTISLPDRIDFSTVVPFGIGYPEPRTYPARTNSKVVNGHITAKDVAAWNEALASAQERRDTVWEAGYELAREVEALFDPEAKADLAQMDAELTTLNATIERLEARIESGACAPGCQDHDVWVQYHGVVTQPDGTKRVVKECDVPLPELSVDGDSDATDRWDLVPDVLVSYVADNRAVSLAQQDAGFDYVDQVWVDGVPYGVVEIAPDVQDEFLPTFRFSYRHGGADVRARCYCGWNLVYSDLCSRRGVLVEDPSVNMQSFVASLLRHSQENHPTIGRDDVCEHGFRRYVSSKSRATGQPFRAKFCASRTKPCDPVWVND